MNAETQQIVKAYEVANMSPEEIHDSFCPDIEVETIKATLFQFSRKWKEENGIKNVNGVLQTKEGVTLEDVSDGEFEQIKAAYKDLALHSDSDEIRSRALKWLWNEKKKRNDPKSKQQLPSVNFSISVFNQHLLQAREVLQKQKALQTQEQQQIIDVTEPQSA